MRSAALVVVILATNTGSLPAQETSILAGGVHARFADSLSGSAALFSLRLRGRSPSASGTFEGFFSQFAAGEWALQLGARGAASRSLGEGFYGGVSGSITANNFQGGSWSGGAAGGPLIAFSGRLVRAVLGGSAGALRRVDESWLALGTSYLRVGYEVDRGISLEGGMMATAADTLRYADATLGVNFSSSRVMVSVGGGARIGDLADDPWGQLRVSFSAAPWLELEGAVGRYPRDLTGFTDGVFATAGARIRLRRDRSDPLTSPASPLRVERVAAGRVRIWITYDENASRLEIAGDWNNWIPFPLRHEGSGRWSIELRLESGMYKYALLVDGEDWTVPTGAPTLPDDLGGKVGLFTVR